MRKVTRSGPMLGFAGAMTLCMAALAGQPADQAYDHYIVGSA